MDPSSTPSPAHRRRRKHKQPSSPPGFLSQAWKHVWRRRYAVLDLAIFATAVTAMNTVGESLSDQFVAQLPPENRVLSEAPQLSMFLKQ